MKYASRIPDILGIRYPIIQGAMSWMTDARLVAAVSNAGGLGMLGPHAGQTTNPSSNEEVIERMRAEIRKVKSLTDKPFAVPVMISENPVLLPLMRDLIIAEQVPVVLINVVLDPDLFNAFREAGIRILFRAHDATPENSREAERLGADIIIATGFDEGGTVPTKTIGTFSITPQIVQAVNVPVMAAGGIADVTGVRAVFALGAEGVYIGSAFLATTESRMADNVKQMMVDCTAEDLLLFRTLPAFYRSLPTRLAQRMVEMSEAGASREDIAQVMEGSVGMRRGMLEGNLENGYISVGNGISYIREIRSVQALVDDLMQDFRN
ncbi:MAG: nitronate monooxygenase [Lautropia sp.]|nr:nitronate monooxygenase [Lautropia sp.]